MPESAELFNFISLNRRAALMIRNDAAGWVIIKLYCRSFVLPNPLYLHSDLELCRIADIFVAKHLRNQPISDPATMKFTKFGDRQIVSRWNSNWTSKHLIEMTTASSFYFDLVNPQDFHPMRRLRVLILLRKLLLYSALQPILSFALLPTNLEWRIMKSRELGDWQEADRLLRSFLSMIGISLEQDVPNYQASNEFEVRLYSGKIPLALDPPTTLTQPRSGWQVRFCFRDKTQLSLTLESSFIRLLKLADEINGLTKIVLHNQNDRNTKRMSLKFKIPDINVALLQLLQTTNLADCINQVSLQEMASGWIMEFEAIGSSDSAALSLASQIIASFHLDSSYLLEIVTMSAPEAEPKGSPLIEGARTGHLLRISDAHGVSLLEHCDIPANLRLLEKILIDTTYLASHCKMTTELLPTLNASTKPAVLLVLDRPEWLTEVLNLLDTAGHLVGDLHSFTLSPHGTIIKLFNPQGMPLERANLFVRSLQAVRLLSAELEMFHPEWSIFSWNANTRFESKPLATVPWPLLVEESRNQLKDRIGLPRQISMIARLPAMKDPVQDKFYLSCRIKMPKDKILDLWTALVKTFATSEFFAVILEPLAKPSNTVSLHLGIKALPDKANFAVHSKRLEACSILNPAMPIYGIKFAPFGTHAMEIKLGTKIIIDKKIVALEKEINSVDRPAAWETPFTVKLIEGDTAVDSLELKRLKEKSEQNAKVMAKKAEEKLAEEERQAQRRVKEEQSKQIIMEVKEARRRRKLDLGLDGQSTDEEGEDLTEIISGVSKLTVSHPLPCPWLLQTAHGATLIQSIFVFEEALLDPLATHFTLHRTDAAKDKSHRTHYQASVAIYPLNLAKIPELSFYELIQTVLDANIHDILVIESIPRLNHSSAVHAGARIILHFDPECTIERVKKLIKKFVIHDWLISEQFSSGYTHPNFTE